MTVHFIITRPLENCNVLKQRLPKERVTYLPVMHFAAIKDALQIESAKIYDYIVTSQYAAKMITKCNFEPFATYYCVGPVTGKILQNHGYRTVIPPEHNAEGLIKLIKTEHKSKKGFLYLCGETIKHPIHETLQENGILCKQRVIYKTIPIQNNWTHILHAKGMKAIVFYSKQSYDLFIKDVQTYHHIKDLEVCHAIWVLPASSTFKCSEYTSNIKWQKISVINSTDDLVQFIHKETNL